MAHAEYQDRAPLRAHARMTLFALEQIDIARQRARRALRSIVAASDTAAYQRAVETAQQHAAEARSWAKLAIL